VVVPSFEESGAGGAVADPANCPTGYGRGLAPEALLGDTGPNPDIYIFDRGRLIPGYATTMPPGEARLSSIDYTTIGPVGQVRAVVEQLYALGTQDVKRYNMFPDPVNPNDFIAEFGAATAGPPPVSQLLQNSLGFLIDFGIENLTFAPFDMQVRTAGFTTFGDGGVVDRNMVLRIAGSNGGRIFVPWAMRINASMQLAMAKVAATVPTGVSPAHEIRIVALPTNIANTFSATVQFLTANSPVTAEWAVGMGVHGQRVTTEHTT